MIFADTPDGFQSYGDVVGCFLESNGKFLLLRRSLGEKVGVGMWGLPAGKVEMGETTIDAIIRELREETGFVFEGASMPHLFSVAVLHEERGFHFHAFRADLGDRSMDGVKLCPAEHDAYAWFSPEEALRKADLIHDLNACIGLAYPRP